MVQSDTEAMDYAPARPDYGKPNKRNKRKRQDKEEEASSPVICSPELKLKMMEMIQNIMRKDVHMIFAEPVSDAIAPGYSSIIMHPMDLSTMQSKVQRGEYRELRELKQDADLMCQNCMVYNADDTIFYKEGVKLQNFINSLFGEKKSKSSFTSNIQEGLRKKQELQEEWEAEEIAESVKRAAKLAREKFEAEAADTRIGFLSQQDDKIVLNVLNASPGEPTQKVLDMDYFTPHEDTATSLLHNFKEKRRVPGKPIQYLHYGPYGSFAPTYDSVFASLDKADQDLLYRCYGDETGLSYCRSVQEFARGAADSLRTPVDCIINSLTAGGHSKANRLLAQKYAKIIRDRRLVRGRRSTDDMPVKEEDGSSTTGEGGIKQEKKEEEKNVQGDKSTDVTPMPEIKQEQEELSLLKLLEAEQVPDILGDTQLFNRLETATRDDVLQTKLNKTGELLKQLHNEQIQRLSVAPETKAPSEVTATENELAQKVKDNLADMIKTHVPGPEGVVSREAVRDSFTSDAVPTSK